MLIILGILAIIIVAIFCLRGFDKVANRDCVLHAQAVDWQANKNARPVKAERYIVLVLFNRAG